MFQDIEDRSIRVPEEQNPEKSVSDMDWAELLESPNVPRQFKDFILLQLQGNDQNFGFIRRARFGLTAEEEIEKRRKDSENLLSTTLTLAQLKAVFVDFLRDELIATGKEIDNVNNAINTLNGKKGHKAEIEELEDYRNKLRIYRTSIKDTITNAAKVTSIGGLRLLMKSFGGAAKLIYNNRDKILFGIAAAGRAVGEVLKLTGQGLGRAASMIPLPF